MSRVGGQEWRLLAACRGTDPEAPFADPGTPQQQAFVVTFCRHCDVRKECLEFGLRSGPYGVYGGLNAVQRGRLTGRKRRTPTPVGGGPLPTCGTERGYRFHREKRFEDACQPCKTAWTAYCNERRRIRLGRTA